MTRPRPRDGPPPASLGEGKHARIQGGETHLDSRTNQKEETAMEQPMREPVFTESGPGPSTRNRTEDGERSATALTLRRGRISPWPERSAELLRLVNAPDRLTNQEICDQMGLRKAQIDWGLSVLRAGGAVIERGRKEPPPPLPSTHPLFGVTDDWTVKKIALLRALWADVSLGTTEIGRRVGVSKNAAVGKAHRLGLPARPSPIHQRGADSPPKPKRAPPAPRATLPPLPSATPSTPVPKRLLPLALNRPLASSPAAPTLPPLGPESAAAPVTYATAHRGQIVTCCWPIGEPGTRTFRFCDDPSEPGRPYCETHVKPAYVKIPLRPKRVNDGYARPSP